MALSCFDGHGRPFSGGAGLAISESGKRNDRPELARARKLGRKQRATLLIGKLDSWPQYRVHCQSHRDRVDFVAVDKPKANRLTPAHLGGLAEHEQDIPPTSGAAQQHFVGLTDHKLH